MRILISTILTTIILYIGIVLYFYFFQSHFVYHPKKNIFNTPDALGLEFEDIKYTAPGKSTITGWFIPTKNAKYTMLYCHGNAGNIATHLDHIYAISKIGVNIFIFDYQGYGNTAGKPSEENTYQDAETAWAFLIKEKKISPNNIIIYGHSLGGAIASKLATTQPAKGLILEGSFTDIIEIGQELYPYLPIKKLCYFKYNSKHNLASIKYPVLIIHSKDDEVIPYKHGEMLYKIANNPKSLLKLAGSHDETYVVSRFKYRNGIAKYLESLNTLDPI